MQMHWRKVSNAAKKSKVKTQWALNHGRVQVQEVENACPKYLLYAVSISDLKFRNSNRRKNPIRHSKGGNWGSQITQDNSSNYSSVNFCINISL